MNQEPSTSKSCSLDYRISHGGLNNSPVACISKLSDWEGSPPRSLLPQTTSKLLNLVMVFCSLDPVIVHNVVKSKA